MGKSHLLQSSAGEQAEEEEAEREREGEPGGEIERAREDEERFKIF